jgi:LmbE family N-acetylglucosaminyl deacetylase
MPIALFLFAHPDDEFAVAPLIRMKTAAGMRVLCLYLTDGAFGRQSSSRRNAETCKVLARLGVPVADVRFIGMEHGLADGSLPTQMEDALQAVASAVDGEVAELFFPSWEGGHQDHDATHLIGLALHSKLVAKPRLRQFPLYHGAGLPGPWFRLLSPLPANGPVEDTQVDWKGRLEQARVAFSYPSQWRTWMGLGPFLLWHAIADGRIRLQPIDAGRVREPPHASRLLYERRGFFEYEEFKRLACPFVAAHIRLQ